MRIAFFYDFPYPWHTGGIEKIYKVEADGLAKGNEVHFYTMRWPGMHEEFTRNRVHYHAYPDTSQKAMYLHRRRSIRMSILFALTGFRLFNSSFDFVIINQFPYLHIPIMKLYCALHGSKLIMRVDEAWDRGAWVRYAGLAFGTAGYLYSRMVMGLADTYVMNSYDTKRQFERIFGISEKRTNIFVPVLDAGLIDKVRNRQLRKGKSVIFAGRLIREKRVDKWVYAFSKLADGMPGVKGVIIGSGPEHEYISGIIRKLKLQDKVKIVKPVKTTLQLYNLISRSSAMLNMSEREGLSIVTLESLSLGVPVILPDYSPIPDMVKEMCIVRSEEDIPDELKRIIKSDGTNRFIKNSEYLSSFQTSGVDAFYGRLFRRLGNR